MKRAKSPLLLLCAVFLSACATVDTFSQARSQSASDEFLRAVNDLKSGQFEIARHTFERLIIANPDDLEARNNLAVCLIKLRRYNEAEDHLKYILIADPEKAGSQQNVGVARQGLKRTDDALTDTNKSVELYQNQKNPEIAAALFNKGWLLDEQGKLKEAIEAYRESVKVKPDYNKAWLGLAIALAKDKQFVEANKALSEAEKLQGQNADFIQLVANNKAALAQVMEQTGFVLPKPVSFWTTGLIGRYQLYESRPVLTVVGYVIAHLFIFGVVQAGIRSYYIAPLRDNEVGKDFLICAVLGALLFLVGWGYAHWIILIILALSTGLLAAMTSQ
jgi:tetratricopeptide (TPR) repeat protein